MKQISTNLSRLFCIVIVLSFTLSCCFYACYKADISHQNDANNRDCAQTIADWNSLWLDVERHADGFRPPVSARTFAHISIAAYETAVSSHSNSISFYETLTNKSLAVNQNAKPAQLAVALNAAYSYMFKMTFVTVGKVQWAKILALEKRNFEKLQAGLNPEDFKNSKQYGEQIAEKIWKWSATDKIGHEAQMHNFDMDYPVLSQIGTWQPDSDHPMPALLPFWGKVKPFLLGKDEKLTRPPNPYSEDPNSDYYKEALEVYTLTTPLTKENKWIADFWSDDHPGLTFTPATRWISITNQLVAQKNKAPLDALEIYLKVGVALCDASIACWNSKYHYKVERPKQFIQRVINPNWVSPSDSPAFPSFPSGHAMFGSSAAQVLAHYFGQNIGFLDRSHENRKEFEGMPRYFDSFHDMVSENAYSRLLIGVHTKSDCEEGIRLGTLIGKKVLNLNLQKQNSEDITIK